jgi:hypothetical protein
MVVGTRGHPDGIQDVTLDVVGIRDFTELGYNLSNCPIVDIVVLHGLSNFSRWPEVSKSSNDLACLFLTQWSVFSVDGKVPCSPA